MSAARTPVHFLHSSTLIGGGNKVLLRLIDGLASSRYEPMSVVPKAGPMTAELATRNIPTWQITLNEPTSAPVRLLRLAKLSAYLRRHGRSIVHVNDPITYGFVQACLPPASAHWICHIHHPDVDRATLKWAFRKGPQRILTPSRYVAEHVAGLLDTDGLAQYRERIVPVMNPIDTGFFTPDADRQAVAARLKVDPQVIHLVTAGAITAHKGQDLFVRVVAALRTQGLPVVGHVIGGVQPGSEAYDASVKKLAADVGVGAHITFHGFTSDERVRDLFRLAATFVLPTAEEGFGLVLAEAGACATPVVSTNIRPLDEVVQDGRTGLLVPRTPEAITEAVKGLLTNPERRQAMAECGHDWVVQSFGAEAYTARVTDTYAAVLE